MSTSRAAALRYASEVQEKRSNRKQPNVFGRPTQTGPPSYAFQNSQKRNVDDQADETRPLRNEEKQIENDQEKDVVDKNSFTPAKPSGNAMVPTITTSAQPAAEQGLKAAFSKCWTTVSTIQIPKLSYDHKSSFTPISISMCETIFTMEELITGNDELRWINPNYFSLPVRVYYSCIFMVQTLRSKEQAGKITKSEGTWLRAFFRRFKDTSCPIAGPLIPIFSNIVSSLPDDNQFDYVYPTIPVKGTYSSDPAKGGPKSNVTIHSTHFIIPSIPLIGDMLYQFCRKKKISDDNFDEQGNYVPFRLSSGGTIGGVRFPALQNGNSLDRSLSQLLLNPILSQPLPESKNRLKEIHLFYSRSRATGFPTPDPDDGFNPTNPSDFTLLGEELDWFQICVDMATTQAKFFTNSTNLSTIPTVGGQSSVVQVNLDFGKKFNQIPTTLDNWFPDIYRNVKASFRSTTATLELDHTYEAAFALTNGKIPWKDKDGNQIGSRASGLRDGPYWDNRKFNFMLNYPTPVMTGLYSMMQSHFYEAHGNAKD